jgi:hypothetical protein
MTDYVPYLGDVLAGIASSDSAQQRQQFDRLLAVGAQDAWSRARTTVQDQLKSQLGKGDLIAPGVSLYEIDVNLAQDVSLARATGGSSASSGIPFQLRLGPDSITAKSTTPTALGSYADPRFTLDFAVAVDFTLFVDPGRMILRLEVGSAHVTGNDFTGNPTLVPENFAGEVADLLGGTVIPWFGGPNYVTMVESAIGQQDFAGVLNQALQPVNDLLGELAKQGFGSVVALFPDATPPAGLSAQAVQLGGMRSPESAPLLVLAQPVSGVGVIRGEIRWPESDGAPTIEPPYVDAFTVSASVERHAAVGAFAQETDVTHLGGWSFSLQDGTNVISYSLVSLPTDEPITVRCGANAVVPWNGPAQGKIHSVEPEGWTGSITIHPPVSVTGSFREQEGHFGAADKVELNPQPIPPGHEVSVQQGLSGGGDKVELNPQPIPPGHEVSVQQGFGGVGDKVELNPQPIPPGHEVSVQEGQTLGGVADKVELNPQPIPPGRTTAASMRQGAFNMDVHSSVDTMDRGASSMAIRQNPTGAGQVAGIDWVVHQIDQPK